MKEKVIGRHDNNKTVGSFRNVLDIQKRLPKKLYDAIFETVSNALDTRELINISSNKTYLNNGAFGHAYDAVKKLSVMLREFSEEEPEVFYDQICLPLVNNSYEILEDFFQTRNLVLVPNCTLGMRCISDLLIRDGEHTSVGCLLPIYGATAKLLQYYESESTIKSLIKISPGENPLLEEDDNIIVKALQDAYDINPFSVLFCDHVASQSGRILPLNEIANFCQEHGIKIVVDGTQSCELLLGNNRDVLKKIDFFVMSTHKWLGNVKTCGIIRFKDHAPLPPAISFGWEPEHKTCPNIERIRTEFSWLGMLDSYISYITLGKAIKIFSKYGEEQFFKSSQLLKEGLSKYLKVVPLLPKDKDRVINIFELETSNLASMKDVNSIQNALQDYGIFISVKKVGTDCSGVTVDGQKILNIQDSPSKMRRRDEEMVCTMKPKPSFYLRLSSWSFNDDKDFKRLAQIFNNNLPLSTTTNAGLRQHFLYIFELYEKLFSTLKTKAFFIRAERLRHHLIFYYGHTAVFYINKLIASGHLSPSYRFDPRLESSMSVGVDEMSWDDLLEDNYDWSNLNQQGLEEFLKKVKEYRKWVKKLILKKIDEIQITNPISQGSFGWVLMMGIEHEKIHLETSAVIISQVPIDLIKTKHNFNFPTYWQGKKFMSHLNQYENEAADKVQPNKLVTIPGGDVFLGKAYLESDFYGWDNEFGSESKKLKSFEASQMLVSNEEYLQFVEDGGYKEVGKRWWSEEGWRYVTDLEVTGPRFWIKNHTTYRSMLEEIPLPWNFPVEVNNLEADAFCRWKSEKLGKEIRLISHEESLLMRLLAEGESSNSNLNKYASSTPVNLYHGKINGTKVYDISGNVWRHSVSVLTIMDGFKTDPIYNDFTLPTIDGYHNHILGGSWISLGNCANIGARYGFRRHFYQYAGIRYVSSDNTYHDRVQRMFDEVKTTCHITENYSDFLDETLVANKPVPNWPKLLGELCSDLMNKEFEEKPFKIFVAYGGVGRVTLEILRKCKNVQIDHSDVTANKLQVLQHLLKESKIQWYQQVEGNIIKAMDFSLVKPVNSLLADKGNTVAYWQADYNNIRSQLDGYDVIVADVRHKDGGTELNHIVKRLKDGGILLLGSIDDVDDNSFDEEHSNTILKTKFQKIDDAPTQRFAHIYGETRNKHQYAISCFSAWRKLQSKDTTDLSKFNVIPSSSEVKSTTDYYEDSHILKSYDAFHFGDGLLSVKNFPLRMAEVIIEMCKKHNSPFNAALDAGCGPGRTAIELCKEFKQVEGYDYSHGFIKMMEKQKGKKNLTNLRAYQGDSHQQTQITTLKKFDMIFGCNLIDRLHTPQLWLQQSKEMLTKDGLLIISSPYTWKPEHTSPDKWIGGFKRDGEDVYTVDGLRAALAPDLILLEEVKVPFVIPDADGTFQYTYSNCTVFGHA